MRLPEPFIKLPLSVDAVALAREVLKAKGIRDL